MKFKQTILCLSLSMVFCVQANALSRLQTAGIDYSNAKAEVILANDKIHTSQAVTSMITSDVAIAVNGGFFNSYHTTPIVYPSNAPLTYGAIIKDGVVINAGGYNNMIAFTYDGQILMDRVNVVPQVLINDSKTIGVWGANTYYSSDSSIVILTDDFGYELTINDGSMVYTVDNGIVINIDSNTSQTVDEGTFKIVYNSEAYESADKWNNLPTIGDKAELTYNIIPTTTNDDWNNVENAISGGRLLVLNGVDISASETYNATYDTQDKQDNYSSLQRSFAYTTADGKIYFATAVGSFSEIASYLVSIGATNAISLDGGASSMLYSVGSYLTPAGRNLSTVLAIVLDETYVEEEEVVEQPSFWAVDDVNQAVELDYVPSDLLNSYTSDITRAEFCSLVLQYITQTTNLSVEELLERENISMLDVDFDDTDDEAVLAIASLGIVKGTGENKFKPNDFLTREESATVLGRMVALLGTVEDIREQLTFSDSANISSWAVDGVNTITSYSIMNGNANGTFTPNDNYTREQAIITIINCHNKIILK